MPTDEHDPKCHCDECALTPAEAVAKRSGVGALDAHDVELAQLREQVRLLTIAASATGNGYLPLILREAVRTGDEASCRAWAEATLTLTDAPDDRERVRLALESRNEAWARVASAEEGERKVRAELEQLRGDIDHAVADIDEAVETAIAAEREACAQVAENCGNPMPDGPWSAARGTIAAAIRARKP